ncbi:MAG: 50S ribosomal protein L2 [Chitinophagales bacterium]
MAIKKHKPITPGTRHRISNTYAEITTNVPEKSLVTSIGNSGGRNNQGRMTMRYLGGGNKRQYRIIDFKRNNYGIEGKVTSIEYDPFRTAFISLIVFGNGDKRYILAPAGIKVGDTVVSGSGSSPDLGNALPLSEVPLGSMIHAIELQPGKGAQMVRSAGANAQLLSREGKYALLKLSSGENRLVLASCLATMGTVSNGDHSLEIKGKAGKSRHIGRRPRVRGVAMNPVDHPMGGGEGRSTGGHPRSRNGQKSKGLKTRDKNKASSKHIISRRKK